ncbi:hypothetical protein BKA70DRAFT_1450231 [Coprinopsis sp. MPI-PUGE-AT-0042]|nr:hypothetical protein BKA70DRAFT_1450231 [Coprinopsis sp. MPI-PUGE-AT-0042]
MPRSTSPADAPNASDEQCECTCPFLSVNAMDEDEIIDVEEAEYVYHHQTAEWDPIEEFSEEEGESDEEEGHEIAGHASDDEEDDEDSEDSEEEDNDEIEVDDE